MFYKHRHIAKLLNKNLNHGRNQRRGQVAPV